MTDDATMSATTTADPRGVGTEQPGHPPQRDRGSVELGAVGGVHAPAGAAAPSSAAGCAAGIHGRPLSGRSLMMRLPHDG